MSQPDPKPNNHPVAWARFVAKALADFSAGWDGVDLQDILIECGLLAEHDACDPCGDGCVCEEYGLEFPLTCCRATEAGRAAQAAIEVER